MTNPKFDPVEWAQMNNSTPVSDNGQSEKLAVHVMKANPSYTSGEELAKARAVAKELIRMGANIAESYDDYVKLGFALASGLGSDGRDIYHELCAQSSKYQEDECEKKWQECLSNHNDRVTIASFYKMAQDNGVNLTAIPRYFSSNPQNPQLEENYQYNENTTISGNTTFFPQCEETEESEENATGTTDEEETAFTCTFSDKIDLQKLPPLMYDAIMTQTDAEDRDMIALGLLTIISGATPNVQAVYDQRIVYPPFYSMLIAPPASGKGILPALKRLMDKVEEHMEKVNERTEKQYRKQLMDSSSLNKAGRAQLPAPIGPPYRSVWVPANSSVSAVYKALSDNDGAGITFETEADTLSQALKSDYGNYSDLLRKAFHHEEMKLNRRKDNEHLIVKIPRWALLLTCTPNQVPNMLACSGNGTDSRFIFYCLRRRLEWHNVFDKKSLPLETQFKDLGDRYFKIYKALYRRKYHPLEFVLSDSQEHEFNRFFEELQLEQTALHGDDLIAFVRRLGLVCFRIAMVLTILRQENQTPIFNPLSHTLVCSDDDFKTALAICNCLINNTAHVYCQIYKDNESDSQKNIVSIPDIVKKFYEALPDHFTTQEYNDCATKLNITMKTAERYIGHLINKYDLLVRIQNGKYQKKSQAERIS